MNLHPTYLLRGYGGSLVMGGDLDLQVAVGAVFCRCSRAGVRVKRIACGLGTRRDRDKV